MALENASSDPAALKVRVIGEDGLPTHSFNLYLGGNDAWTAVVDRDADGRLIMRTRDPSCAVPRGEETSRGWVQVTDTQTTRGWIEVIEMAELGFDEEASGAAANLIGSAGASIPSDCPQLERAWGEGGYWTIDPTVDALPPTGAIAGELSMISVEAGKLATYRAVAIARFTVEPLHSAPESRTPDLRDANSAVGDGVVSAVIVDGHRIEDRWEDALDAVNAALMVSKASGRFVSSPTISAESSVEVTFPTWAFRANADGSIRAPFFASETDDPGERIFAHVLNENGVPFDINPHTECDPPPCPNEYVIAEAAFSSLVVDPSLWANSSGVVPTGGLTSGFIELEMYARNPLENPNSGNRYVGLPLLVFLKRDYGNGDLRDAQGRRVRANYSDILPMRRTPLVRVPAP